MFSNQDVSYKHALFRPASDMHTADRKTLEDYLSKHFRYYTMNSWNQSTSYANNIKLYNLNIAATYGEDAKDKAWRIVCDPELDCTELDMVVSDIMHDFQDKTGYAMGINGRSGGYIVLYDTTRDPYTNAVNVLPGRGIDMNAEFPVWDIDSLRERAELVAEFDETCEQIVEAFMQFVLDAEIIEQTRTIEITTRHLMMPDKE